MGVRQGARRRCGVGSADRLPALGTTDASRVSSGRLAALLERPAPATTQANLVSQAVAHLTLYGNAYLGKFRDENGRLEQLACLNPENVTVELVRGTPRYTVTDPKTGRESQHGTDDIVHVKALSTDGLVGLSPIRQCRVALALASGLGEHAQAFFENGARPSGILKVGAQTKDQVDALRDQLTGNHAGARNAHRIAILTGETEWTALAGPLDDLQFVEQRKLSTAEIARVFRVPPWMIGASSGDSMTYCERRAASSSRFVTHSLSPGSS